MVFQRQVRRGGLSMGVLGVQLRQFHGGGDHRIAQQQDVADVEGQEEWLGIFGNSWEYMGILNIIRLQLTIGIPLNHVNQYQSFLAPQDLI